MMKEMLFLVSVRPVNPFQVKFKFGSRKETSEKLPGGFLTMALVAFLPWLWWLSYHGSGFLWLWWPSFHGSGGFPSMDLVAFLPWLWWPFFQGSGGLLTLVLSWLRWDPTDSSSTVQTSIYRVLILLSLRNLRLIFNFASLLRGVFCKPPPLAVVSLTSRYISSSSFCELSVWPFLGELRSLASWGCSWILC